MNVSGKDYKRYAEARAKRSPWIKNLIKAFTVGGGICVFAQGLTDLWMRLGIEDKDTAGTLTSVSLIFIAVLLTGIGVFDKIARFAGGGTLVPITGFANSIVSEALEFKSEGYILGMCANMFKLAGPVLVMGISASIFYGIILLFL